MRKPFTWAASTLKVDERKTSLKTPNLGFGTLITFPGISLTHLKKRKVERKREEGRRGGGLLELKTTRLGGNLSTKKSKVELWGKGRTKKGGRELSLIDVS